MQHRRRQDLVQRNVAPIAAPAPSAHDLPSGLGWRGLNAFPLLIFIDRHRTAPLADCSTEIRLPTRSRALGVKLYCFTSSLPALTAVVAVKSYLYYFYPSRARALREWCCFSYSI